MYKYSPLPGTPHSFTPLTPSTVTISQHLLFPSSSNNVLWKSNTYILGIAIWSELLCIHVLLKVFHYYYFVLSCFKLYFHFFRLLKLKVYVYTILFCILSLSLAFYLPPSSPSLPSLSGPGQVMNVRVFPYSPLRNEQKFSALVVWDSLSQIESGGRVDHYFVSITDAATGQLPALAQFVSYSASSLPSLSPLLLTFT